MLEHLESAGFANIVSFQPHGRAVRIHHHQQFVNEVLPRYFPDINNVASFLRQLNIYGFRRMIDNGPDHNSYYHAMFLRGRPDLCQLIERPLKGQYSKRRKYDPSTEPKFYTMPPIQLLPEGNDIKKYFTSSDLPGSDNDLRVLKNPRRLERGWENDTMEMTTFFESTAQHHDSYIDHHKMPPTSQAGFRSSSSFLDESSNLQSLAEAYALKGENYGSDDGNALSIAEKSESVASKSATALSHAAEYSIGIESSLSSATQHNYQKNNAIPAEVIAAASSLLATPYNPQLMNDPSLSIVDQYCQNLAINILKQASCPAQSLPNALQDEIQLDAPCDVDRELLSHNQYPNGMDGNIAPFSSHTTTDRVDYHNQSEIRKRDNGS
jgi:hypothetical protein